MSKKLFTEEEIKVLTKNKYVKKVTNKGITYTDEFRMLFIDENNNGKSTIQIFNECGFDSEVLGVGRIKSIGKRWRSLYRNGGISRLTDKRTHCSGRPTTKNLSLEEKYARLEAKMKLLKAENELLKKLDNDRKAGVEKKVELKIEEKYIAIANTIKKHKLKNMISYLCKVSGISRSGYYRYFSKRSINTRETSNNKDEISKKNILKAFNFKNRKKGARQIKMVLESEFGIKYNLKRIRRIMKKYDIICPIRKANAYKRMMKATKEHTVVPNLLNREFKQDIPGKVLLTDITYLTYNNSKRAYLSTIKDSSTNEILAYKVSSNLKIDIVLDTIDILSENIGDSLHKDAFIHSDQGVHYTSPKFQKKIKSMGLGQSMSRRGNCWDNAPQESFFGHFKDEVNFKICNNLEEVKREIAEYMEYYNNYRYQWNLKKMTPVQYRSHLDS
ncbi:IS3 family transposase [Clostridium sp. CCUG 7971]|uniref:IS3 family transposase n=1 Tax=Clostridium sp. CCUG 7971 TaxID=2811414 RepID=UPI00256FFAE9|nr:IS3 family transposase [Clostridium sp. CCUG 7971]